MTMGSKYSKNYKKMKEGQLKIKLRRQIAALKSLPANFRDSNFESQPFLDAMNAISDPKTKKEMMDWSKGPILYVHPLTMTERQILGPSRLVRSLRFEWNFLPLDATTHFQFFTQQLSPREILDLIEEAEHTYYDEQLVSFIYLKNLTEDVLKGLNALCHYGHYNCRFKRELIEKNGSTPGL